MQTALRSVLIIDVATRWYRAPEIMLSFANYVSAVRDGFTKVHELMTRLPAVSLPFSFLTANFEFHLVSIRKRLFA